MRQLRHPVRRIHFSCASATRRRHQIAAVAVARKHYLRARPVLVANETRAMQPQAVQPKQKVPRWLSLLYNIKALRDREMLIAARAEHSYERFVARWKPKRPKNPRAGPSVQRDTNEAVQCVSARHRSAKCHRAGPVPSAGRLARHTPPVCTG